MVLLVILIYGSVWGITGMVMAIPLTAVLRIVLSSIQHPLAQFASRLLSELTPQVVTLLHGLLAFHEPQFVRHLPGFYPLFVDLMHCDSKELRQILREIFSQRIGTVLHERQQAL